MQIDVSDEAQTMQMANQVIERYGRIDGLVNNAALFNGLHITKMEDVDMDEWDRTYAVNVKGTFLCCRAVVPYMKQANGGKIVNIGSGIFLGGLPGWPHYVSSKAAVMGLSRALAKELGAYKYHSQHACAGRHGERRPIPPGRGCAGEPAAAPAARPARRAGGLDGYAGLSPVV